MFVNSLIAFLTGAFGIYYDQLYVNLPQSVMKGNYDWLPMNGRVRFLTHIDLVS